MKSKYYWPNRDAIVFLILYFIISGIACFLVTHSSRPGNDVHFFIILILSVLSPGALIIILILVSFVKITENELIYYKCGFVLYKIKLIDIKEWGLYNTCSRSGWFIYITSIPAYLLKQGDVINKDILKHKNRKKFIMLNYDQALSVFFEKNFPDKKRKLYRCADKQYRQE